MPSAPDLGSMKGPPAQGAPEGRLVPAHPGEILAEEFLSPLGLSQNEVALAMRVPPQRISEIVHGRRAVTADTALRLARYFGTTADFWVNLQARYDLEVARDESGARIDREVLRFEAADP
jgi:addiction module HigA family antidote